MDQQNLKVILMDDSQQTTPDLSQYGINDVNQVFYNPSYEFLFKQETNPHLTGYEKGKLTESGAIAVDTGVFTGRSPKDKYLVKDDRTSSSKKIFYRVMGNVIPCIFCLYYVSSKD